jgi:ABC-type uncharacterized transport system substrate-binding protein
MLRPKISTTLAAVALLLAATPAGAHPHVWVTMKSVIAYAPDGKILGVRHAWAFDDVFSAFALQGISHKTAGAYTREELASLAEINVSSLKEYGFFTYARIDGRKVSFVGPRDYWLDYANSVLTLHFMLPLRQPAHAKSLEVDVYDPTIFVDFEFADKDPVSLAEAPAGCKVAVAKPKDLTVAQGQQLGEAFFNQLSSGYAAQFANRIHVTCP